MAFFSFCVLVLLLFGALWVYQFVQLMSFADTDFPGTHDKILWVVAFLTMFLFAPLAFLCWKIVYISFRQQERQRDRNGML